MSNDFESSLYSKSRFSYPFEKGAYDIPGDLKFPNKMLHQSGTSREVGTQVTINSIQRINIVEGTWTANFHVDLFWKPTEEELRQHKPDWVPEIQIYNLLSNALG